MWVTLENLKLHMWLSLLLLDDAGLALSSEAREVLKAPELHTIWSKPLYLLTRGWDWRGWRCLLYMGCRVWWKIRGWFPCPSQNGMDHHGKSTITPLRFPKWHNSMSTNRIKYKWGGNVGKEYTWQPYWWHWGAVVLTTDEAACKYWVPIPVTGQRAAGVTSWNLYKEKGCHLQSSVNHSPSSCGKVYGSSLDRSMEGQPEDDLCIG